MPNSADLIWSPTHENSYRVHSPWWELVWHPVRGLTRFRLSSSGWEIPSMLGLAEFTSLSRSWNLSHDSPADVFIQGDRITASWQATPQRPIEIHARWILELHRFWLEISLLTPSRLESLTCYTQSYLSQCHQHASPELHPDVRAALLHPALAPDWAYLELAPRYDVHELHVQDGLIRFGLFHDDLEKGVVLRTRLLATYVRTPLDTIRVQRIANDFAHAPPDLSR
ncbi:MAG: hypothetical protein RMJ19_11085 [Gemmatales bacterium]|nr:hypothetical protein [Gemmatales bacterium]MDW8176207.1 hypothetical protein [Gemmatales bacterium]